MVAQTREVRGLLIPLQGIRLVLPDSVIVQILGDVEIVQLAEAPNWMSGVITWQKRTIPVISFELAINNQYVQGQESLVMVLKSLNNIEKMPFYALTLPGIPHPLRLNEENISIVENATSTSPLIMNEALVNGERASIPNMEALEEMIFSHLGLFSQESDDSAA